MELNEDETMLIDRQERFREAARASGGHFLSGGQESRKPHPYRHLDPTAKIFDPVIVLRPENLTIDANARIDSFVKLEVGEGMQIGKYVHVASFCHIGIGGGYCELRDGSAFASGAKILTGSNQPEGESMSASAPPDKQVVVRAITIIGKNAFVGTNATIMPGVKIGDGAVIGAGAVVTKDVPEYEIWAGVPARKIGDRR